MLHRSMKEAAGQCDGLGRERAGPHPVPQSVLHSVSTPRARASYDAVETTARSAYDLGYEVVMLAEATATKTPEEQAASEQHAFPLLGRTLTIDEFFAELGAGAPATTA